MMCWNTHSKNPRTATAHTHTIGAYFDVLEMYIRKFGYTSYVYFEKKKAVEVTIDKAW